MNRRMNCFSQWVFFVLFLLTAVLVKSSNGQAYYDQYRNNANYPMNYQTQSYETTQCNDLRCKNNECCVETYRGPICVRLTAPPTGGQAFCARAKKCSSNAGCPTAASCCQVLLDISFATTSPNPYAANSYGTNSYSYTNSYGNTNYGYSTNNYASMPSYSDSSNFRNGYCRAPVKDEGSTCFEPVDGVQTPECPCAAPNTCTIVLQPFPLGVCTGPPQPPTPTAA